MIGAEQEYIKKILKFGLIQSPCLEMGVGYEGRNNKKIIQGAGIMYFGTDMVPGKDVDYIVDFEDTSISIDKSFADIGKFGSILMVTILEHTFEPIKALDNAFALLRAGGTCIVIVPTVWPIHNYPIDCYRFNPDFFEEYCKRRNLNLLIEYFEYIGLYNVRCIKDSSGAYTLPRPSSGNRFKTIMSRVIHRLFDTYGRRMYFPSILSIGVVIKKP